jgi:hypothetical protein
MATTQHSHATPTDDATYRAWGLAISNAIQASGSGLVKTTDTGQVDWTTATRPYTTSSTGSSVTHYEIYKFNDTLQTTSPVFLRIGYGNAYGTSSAAFTVAMSIQIGTSTNGAGTLTGKTSTLALCP